MKRTWQAILLVGVGVIAVAQAATVPVIDGFEQQSDELSQPAPAGQPPVVLHAPYQRTYDRQLRPVSSPVSQSATSEAASNDIASTNNERAGDLSARLSALEQRVSAGGSVDLLQRVNGLESQVSDLQGKLDVLSHELAQLTQRQTSIYANLDQRLQKSSLADAAPAPQYVAAAPQQPTSNSVQNSAAHGQQYVGQAPSNVASVADNSATQEKNAYLAAYQLIQEQQFDRALQAFQSYSKNYPGSDYLPNVHYWLGELYLQRGNFEQAQQEFSTVVNQYPKSSKRADALLKTGYVYYDTGKWQKARDVWQQVQKIYPESTSAQLAATRLHRMSQQGL